MKEEREEEEGRKALEEQPQQIPQQKRTKSKKEQQCKPSCNNANKNEAALVRCGIIRLRPISAKNLRNVVRLIGTQDPFIRARLQPWNTDPEDSSVVDNGGVNPEWPDQLNNNTKVNQSMVLEYPGWDPHAGDPQPYVEILVMDYEMLTQPREIGRGRISLSLAIVSAAEQASGTFTDPLHSVELFDRDGNGAGVLKLNLVVTLWPEMCQHGTLVIDVSPVAPRGLKQRPKEVKIRTTNDDNVPEADNQRTIVGNDTFLSLFDQAGDDIDNYYLRVTLYPWNVSTRLDLPEKLTASGKRSNNNDQQNVISHTELRWLGVSLNAAQQKGLGVGLQVCLMESRFLRTDPIVATAWVNVIPTVQQAMLAPAKSDTKEPLFAQLMDVKRGECVGCLRLMTNFFPLYDSTATATEARSKRHKALLIGINYNGQTNELRGCVNDVKLQYKLLIERYGANPENIRVLVDEDASAFVSNANARNSTPTAANIRDGLRWLAGGARKGDLLYFHFSGHGSQVVDIDDDEADGMDETLVPVDFNGNNPKTFLTDDELKSSFFDVIPNGVFVTAVYDCCHSGTMSDLQPANVPTHTIASAGGKTPAKVTTAASSRDVRFWPPSEDTVRTVATRAARTQQSNSQVQADGSILGVSKTLGALSGLIRSRLSSRWASSTQPIVVLSACKDEQVAADACIDGTYSGAATWALVRVLEQDPHPHLDDLMMKMHVLMAHRGWEQEPQLALGKQCTTHPTWMMHWNGKAGGFLQVDQSLSRSGGRNGSIASRSIDTDVKAMDASKSKNARSLTHIVTGGSGKKWQTSLLASATKQKRKNGNQLSNTSKAVSALSPSKKPLFPRNISCNRLETTRLSSHDCAVLPDSSPRVLAAPQLTNIGSKGSWVMGQMHSVYAKTGGFQPKSWGHAMKVNSEPKLVNKKRWSKAEDVVKQGKHAATAAVTVVQRSLFPGGRKRSAVIPVPRR